MKTPLKKSPSSHTRSLRKQSGLQDVLKKNFVTLPVALNVGEALNRVRGQAKRGDIFYLYVTGDDGTLIGIVSIRNLLLSPDTEPLSNLVSRNAVYLPADCTRLEAAQRFADCRFLSLPVVSTEGKILGVVQAHDLTAAYSQPREESFDERGKGALFELLGIEAEDSATSPARAARARFPWLLVNMFGGGISALLIHRFAPDLPHSVAFLAFVPILLIMCESIGMQTASVVITKLRHSTGQVGRVAWREFRIATWLGLASALVIGGAIRLFFGPLEVALGVGLSLFLATIVVSGIALAVPVLTRRLGIDPSISSGPVVLAIADSSTLALYLITAYAICKFIL